MKLIAQPGNQSLTERIETGTTPVLFCDTEQTAKTFWEFFFVTIRNPNTRATYMRACFHFADWISARGIELQDVEPMVMAAYIESVTQTHAAPTVKLKLSAIRRLFDYLLIKQMIAINPAHGVRAPRHSVTKGKTPILSTGEMRQLFESIDLSTLSGYRDRAIIATMAYSFARVSAVCTLSYKDYYTQNKRSFFRLHEKGGKFTVVPAHHTAQLYVDEYIEALPVEPAPKAPLYQALDTTRKHLSGRALSRRMMLFMVKRRCIKAGLSSELCNHSFRGTGITNFMTNGGTLETAARIAGHASTTTTQLYDRRDDELTLDEIERIIY